MGFCTNGAITTSRHHSRSLLLIVLLWGVHIDMGCLIQELSDVIHILLTVSPHVRYMLGTIVAPLVHLTAALCLHKASQLSISAEPIRTLLQQVILHIVATHLCRHHAQQRFADTMSQTWLHVMQQCSLCTLTCDEPNNG